MKQRGFTMIEVMVVIVIIGILGALAANTYTKSLSRGRDAKRITDMQEVQKGFESYFAKYDTYTNPTESMFVAELFPSGPPTEKTPAQGPYTYSTPATDYYCACANTENDASYANSGADCDFSAVTKTHFCVTNSQ